MDRKQELEAMIAGLYAELNVIREQEHEAACAKLAGKCFRYRNNYSVPKSDDERWWMYLRIVRGGESAMTVKFQDDKQGRLSLETDTYVQPLSFEPGRDGYEEITEAEFLREWDGFVSKVAATQVKP